MVSVTTELERTALIKKAFNLEINDLEEAQKIIDIFADFTCFFAGYLQALEDCQEHHSSKKIRILEDCYELLFGFNIVIKDRIRNKKGE